MQHPETIKPLLYSGDFRLSTYFNNLKQAFLPFFTWHGVIESIFLAPQISLPATFIAIIGLVSTFKGFFASRNSIAIFLIIFTILISGFHTDYAVLLTPALYYPNRTWPTLYYLQMVQSLSRKSICQVLWYYPNHHFPLHHDYLRSFTFYLWLSLCRSSC